MTEKLSLANPFIRMLASAALVPELRSILLLDASFETVQQAAQLLRQMLQAVNDVERVEIVSLGTTETDDTLWGIPLRLRQSHSTRFVWRGLLAAQEADNARRLVVAPDLALLSLAAERGLVTTMGADVVHVERHGQGRAWRPDHGWIGACAREDVGKISLHLLDRFALRIQMAEQLPRATDGRAEELVLKLANKLAFDFLAILLPDSLRHELSQATLCQPIFTDEAFAQVIAYDTGNGHVRRELTLTRLALAEAMLDASDQVTASHVDRAAALLRLEWPARTEDPHAPGEPVPDVEESQPDITRSFREPEDAALLSSLPGLAAEPQSVPVYEPETEEALPAAFLTAATGTPYPEDEAPPEREAASLRMPFRLPHHKGAQRGPVVGVEQAHDLQDLALVATIFEAAKHQMWRRQKSGRAARHLNVRPRDLRQYRRLPVPESLLVLIVDYTSLREVRWIEALEPHLIWAYTARAAIALIRVGAGNAAHELQAERILGRSLLSPQIGAALDARPGRASPLAHGLELALYTLQHALQHGRSKFFQARLVILTDGRGNVPLAASRAARIEHPVTTEGIDDALAVADKIRLLQRVDIQFLDPGPSQHPELVEILANRLGVAPMPVPRIDEVGLNAAYQEVG